MGDIMNFYQIGLTQHNAGIVFFDATLLVVISSKKGSVTYPYL